MEYWNAYYGNPYPPCDSQYGYSGATHVRYGQSNYAERPLVATVATKDCAGAWSLSQESTSCQVGLHNFAGN